MMGCRYATGRDWRDNLFLLFKLGVDNVLTLVPLRSPLGILGLASVGGLLVGGSAQGVGGLLEVAG